MLTFSCLEDSDFQTPLVPYKDRLWEMFETSTTASNEYNGLRLAGIKGLKIMAIMKHFLSENEVRIECVSYMKSSFC